MEDTVKALAAILKTMWQIDITFCPYRNTVSEKLSEARYYMENDLVDIKNFEPETLGPDGFKDQTGLFNWLDQNRLVEDLVFCHGDFTFPNILISGSEITGLIDWGNGGAADRWQDIALCYRCLKDGYSEYGLYSENDFKKCKSLFFNELGIEPDEEKIKYFILLDEFF